LGHLALVNSAIGERLGSHVYHDNKETHECEAPNKETSGSQISHRMRCSLQPPLGMHPAASHPAGQPGVIQPLSVTWTRLNTQTNSKCKSK
jgi:hypothetical protein